MRHLPVTRPDDAHVPELSSHPPRGRVAPVAGKSASACWRAARSIPASGGVTNSRRTPIFAFTASFAGANAPAAVDVSSLMLEAKAAHVNKHGLPTSDWIFSRIELSARLGSRFPIVTNFLLSRRFTRVLAGSVAGSVASSAAAQSAAHVVHPPGGAARALTRPRPQLPGPRVVYFVDVFANYYDQELAESVVSVLQQAEVNVYVPHRQRSSGLAALLVGDVDHARDQALANLRVLANAVRDGYTVVCSEPTAALMLREEYVKLTEDLDAELVAANTMDVGQYLLGLDARGQLPRPRQPLHARVGYHQPCHLRAQRRQSGPGAAAQRSRARRRVHQPRLFGHGGHLRTRPRSVLDLATRGPRSPASGCATATSRSAPPNADRAGSRWNKESPNALSIPSSF